jgi:hypothetical protein
MAKIENFEREKIKNIVDNSTREFKFKFSATFGMSATQEELFTICAKPLVDDALSGLNGTLFAYGQTGSGKTFTITGGTERYKDRGIIPRSLTYIFETIKKRNQSGDLNTVRTVLAQIPPVCVSVPGVHILPRDLQRSWL